MKCRSAERAIPDADEGGDPAAVEDADDDVEHTIARHIAEHDVGGIAENVPRFHHREQRVCERAGALIPVDRDPGALIVRARVPPVGHHEVLLAVVVEIAGGHPIRIVGRQDHRSAERTAAAAEMDVHTVGTTRTHDDVALAVGVEIGTGGPPDKTGGCRDRADLVERGGDVVPYLDRSGVAGDELRRRIGVVVQRDQLVLGDERFVDGRAAPGAGARKDPQIGRIAEADGNVVASVAGEVGHHDIAHRGVGGEDRGRAERKVPRALPPDELEVPLADHSHEVADSILIVVDHFHARRRVALRRHPGRPGDARTRLRLNHDRRPGDRYDAQCSSSIGPRTRKRAGFLRPFQLGCE